MPRPTSARNVAAAFRWKSFSQIGIAVLTGATTLLAFQLAAAQQPSKGDYRHTANQASNDTRESHQDEKRADRQAELDAGLVKMLSGATLEGSFTSTGADRDPTKLSREKYTLGKVKRLAGNFWLIPARIQYGEHDVTLPITVPIEWAGDTPLVVVDNLPLPGFGTVSARVMFFADHYAGYWKHGDHGGHLFGIIKREESQDGSTIAPSDQDPSVDDASAEQKPKE
jgi:hypothetical protein